jgi:xanthine dehydrogenase accessory factor
MGLKQTEYAKIMGSLVARREPFAVATVVKTEGSALGKPGFKVVISKDGEVVFGSLGGVCPESAIADSAKKTMRTGTPKTVKVFLESVEDAVSGVVKSQSEDEIHVETNCGGTMEIYVEPYLPQQRLVIVGQGGKDDVEDAMVKISKLLDFEVVVIDHSPVLSEEPDQLIKDVDFDLSRFKFNEGDSVVVLTKGARDVEILTALSKFKLEYVGLMASKQRTKDDFDALLKAGVDRRFVEAIHAPVGADIGAITPSEIALSIAVDVVASRRGKKLPSKQLEAAGAHPVKGEAPH